MNDSFEFDPKAIRLQLRMNQQEFWGRVGVAQSCGSRYESGRCMPKPVQELLRVVHSERIDLSKKHDRDNEILDYLKAREPETYLRLQEAVGSAVARSTVTEIQSGQSVAKPQPSRDIAERELPALEVLTHWVNRRTGDFQSNTSSDATSIDVRRHLMQEA